jgi:hypothetical protein
VTKQATNRNLFDRSTKARIGFAAAYLGAQAALVLTGDLRPDGLFAFRMFNESSTIAIAIGRRVATTGEVRDVRATDGAWEARDASGAVHRFQWGDRVRDPILRTLGRPVHASYGVDAQLFRLQAALDDVADHLPGDNETRALVADVTIRQNGRAPYEKRLESRARLP